MHWPSSTSAGKLRGSASAARIMSDGHGLLSRAHRDEGFYSSTLLGYRRCGTPDADPGIVILLQQSALSLFLLAGIS